MMIWDRPSFEKLWDATRLAGEAGMESFSVDLGRKKGGLKTFDTIQALELCHELDAQFKAVVERAYPENREGKEPDNDSHH